MTEEERLTEAFNLARKMQDKLQESMTQNLRLQGQVIVELTWLRLGKRNASLSDLALAAYDVKKELGLKQPFPREVAPRVYSHIFTPGNAAGILN